MRSRLAAKLALAVLVAAAGCAPSLTTMEPARTTPAGHFQLTSSVEVTDTSGPIRESIEDLRDLEGGGPMTRSDLDIAADAAAAALVQPPSIGYQVSLAYGLSRRFEVGVRSSMNAVRGWTRFQFLRASPGWYGALGLGVTGYLYGFPIQQFAQEVEVAEHSRWDVDLPLHLGFSSKAFHIWAGPKLVLSTYDAALTVCVDQADGRCDSQAGVTLDGTARYVAGQAGLAVGWERFFVAVELTLASVQTDAEVTVDYAGRIESKRLAADGVVLSPAVGVIFWF